MEEYGRDWYIHGCHVYHEIWEQLLEQLHYDGRRTCQFRPEQSRLYCPYGPRFPLDAVPMTAENSSTCCLYFHRAKSLRAKVTKSKTPTKAKPAKGRSPRQSRTTKGKGQQASKSPPKKTQVASVKDDSGVSDVEVYTFVTILIMRRKCLPC